MDKFDKVVSWIIIVLCVIGIIVGLIFNQWALMVISIICNFSFAVRLYLLRKYIPEQDDVCDACGKNPKAPNSQICTECQKIIEDYVEEI